MGSSLDSLMDGSSPSSGSRVVLVLVFFGLVLLVVSGVMYGSYLREEKSIEIVSLDQSIGDRMEMIHVDISGAVSVPGVYIFENTARVRDVLVAAEGLVADADAEWVQKRLNLAAEVSDGQKIYIPFKGEEDQVETFVVSDGDGLVGINSASESELVTLPGVGPVLAAEIISYRERNGPFGTVDDLVDVPGLGKKTVAKFEELVFVD